MNYTLRGAGFRCERGHRRRVRFGVNEYARQWD